MYRRIIRELIPDLDEKSAEFEGVVQKCMIWDEFGNIGKAHVFELLKKEFCPDLDVEYWRNIWSREFCEYQYLADGVPELLTELKEKYILGVITNGDGPSQNAKLTAAGIRQYFDTVTVAGDFGVQKPDPSIYMYAAEAMGLKCDEILFVGDTFATDILGAVRAGMKPVWLCYEHRGISEFPVVRIDKLTDLKEVLR